MHTTGTSSNQIKSPAWSWEGGYMSPLDSGREKVSFLHWPPPPPHKLNHTPGQAPLPRAVGSHKPGLNGKIKENP